MKTFVRQEGIFEFVVTCPIFFQFYFLQFSRPNSGNSAAGAAKADLVKGARAKIHRTLRHKRIGSINSHSCLTFFYQVIQSMSDSFTFGQICNIYINAKKKMQAKRSRFKVKSGHVLQARLVSRQSYCFTVTKEVGYRLNDTILGESDRQ